MSSVKEGVDWGKASFKRDGPRAKGKLPADIANKMSLIAADTDVTGASNVTDAIDAVVRGGHEYRKSRIAALPLAGDDREKFIQHISEAYSPSRVSMADDGTGWFLDDMGVLWRI